MLSITATLRTKKDRPHYYVCIRYKHENTGKNSAKWITTNILVKGNNKRKAQAELERIFTAYKRTHLYSNKIEFTKFISKWLENKKPTISPVTYDSYRIIVNNQIVPFFEPLNLDVDKVNPIHIQNYINKKLEQMSPNTVRKHLFNLSSCFDTAIKQNLISVNPVKQIDMPKKIKYTGAKYYNEKQIEKLLEASKGDVLESIILFALFYGLRRSEIIGLKWSNIDFVNKVFSIKHTVVQASKNIHKNDFTKNTSSLRNMPMSDLIIFHLNCIKERQRQNKLMQLNDYVESDYVFTTITGKLIQPNYVTKHFKALLIKNNLEIIRFHDLRHSSASYLLYLGYNLKEIQAWLGHSDIGTTMNIYAHLDVSIKQNIVDNLNNKFQYLSSN